MLKLCKKSVVMPNAVNKLWGLETVDFSLFPLRETTYVTSCFIFYTSVPFWKGVYSKRKEFTPLGASVFISEWTPFQGRHYMYIYERSVFVCFFLLFFFVFFYKCIYVPKHGAFSPSPPLTIRTYDICDQRRSKSASSSDYHNVRWLLRTFIYLNILWEQRSSWSSSTLFAYAHKIDLIL